MTVCINKVFPENCNSELYYPRIEREKEREREGGGEREREREID